jgi:hypothetical protein
MQMRRYSYQGAAKLRVWWSKFLGIITAGIATLAAAFFVWGALQGKAADTLTCFATGFLLIGWTLGLFFFNAYPDVAVTDAGLDIDFLWRRLHLDWADVIGLRTRGFPWAGFTLVLARRVTPFHVLYSWQFGRILKPGFLIWESMDGYTDLLNTIRTRSHTA